MPRDSYRDDIISDIRALEREGETSFLRDWTVEELIGEGTYGTVYRISPCDGYGIDYALKVVDGDANLEASGFEKEAGLLRSIRSHNLVQIHEYARVGGEQFGRSYAMIRMELLDSLDVRNMSTEEIVKVGVQMCDVLALCHRNGVLHRDIKPDNILVSDKGVYKLSDLGSARVFFAKKTNTVVGTPYYMPPEVADYGVYDARSDIYSLAQTLYVLLGRGKHPFAESGVDESIERRLSGEPLPYIDGRPDALVDILRHAAARNPADRIPTAEQLGRALAQCDLSDKPAPVNEFSSATQPEPVYTAALPTAITDEPIRPMGAAPVQPAEDKTLPETERKKKSKAPAVIGILLILAAAAAFAYAYFGGLISL